MEYHDCDNHETFSYTVFEAAGFDAVKLIGEAERARPKPRNAAGDDECGRTPMPRSRN